MPENVRRDLCEQNTIGKKLFERFVEDRIKSALTNLWAPMKKRQLKTWKSTGKKLKVDTSDKIVELMEDRNLFARMLLVSKSRPDINLADTVGRYELSVVPRSMFAADGTMLHCQHKSSLMNVLENLPDSSEPGDVVSREDPIEGESDGRENHSTQGGEMTVALVDAMAEVQALDKPEHIKTCSHLAEHFVNRIFGKYSNVEEVRVIFDRYDLPASLKNTTRERRQGRQQPASYHITDTTNIAKVPMKRLLSTNKTKMELTCYLAEKLMEKALAIEKRIVVAWGPHCRATDLRTDHLESIQEEADTKLLLHAVDATQLGASSIAIHLPDTDVFILALRRYPVRCSNTSFVTGTGQRRCVIPLQPIYEKLGPLRAAALPGLHALSGADNTGSFAGKGKLAFWKAFQNASDAIVCALTSLGTTALPTDDTIRAIEEFICTVYLPHTTIVTVEKLRWWMFSKKQSQSERLPPSQDALHQAILRAHYQAMMWCNDITPNPDIPPPNAYGWTLEVGTWVPIMTTQPPAPKAVLTLVKCNCSKSRCQTNRCTCRKAAMNCTDMCGCSELDKDCYNMAQGQEPDDDDDTDDEADDLDELSV